MPGAMRSRNSRRDAPAAKYFSKSWPVSAVDCAWRGVNPSYFQVLSADEPVLPATAKTDEAGASFAARIEELERENERWREQLRQQAAVAYGLNAAREQAEAANRLKGEFLANVSHDIRTALGGIMGLTSLLVDTPLNEEQRHLVQMAYRSGDGLITLLNDLLDFSKIEAGCLALDVTDFNVREELQFAFELHAAQAKRKGLEFILDLDPSLPTALRGDPLRLRQMVLNLVGNAVKFTERGGVLLRVRYEAGVPEGRLRCEITDTGVGISLATQSTLFRPFAQAEASTSRNFGGTGLGLAICKRLAELMRGDIGVRSAPGVGSTFWFTVAMAEVGVSEVPAGAPAVSLEGRSVLIVDPHAGCRHGLADLCGAWKMNCEVADSAAMALAQLRWARQRGGRYDVVMMEHLMPGIDGLELARRISSDPEISGPTLVLLSAGGACPPAPELAKCGIIAGEAKPVRPEKLRQTLSQALAQKTQTRGAM